MQGSNGEGRFIATSGPYKGGAGDGALLLLFRQGQRPDGDAFHEAVRKAGRLSVTHHFDEDGAVVGVELLRDGMTYDVAGLSPAAGMPVPTARHRYGFDESGDGEPLEAVSLAPGPHLEAGAHSIPVVRTMAGIAADLLGALSAATAVVWPPARSCIGPGFFIASVASWRSGGAFPALGLTAFDDEPGGGMRSEGLAWFTGQELLISADLAKERAAAARLAIRLVNQLVSQGRVATSEFIVAPDGGRLALEPTRDGKTVRVRRA